MDIRRFPYATHFLHQFESWLREHEAENSVFLGMVMIYAQQEKDKWEKEAAEKAALGTKEDAHDHHHDHHHDHGHDHQHGAAPEMPRFLLYALSRQDEPLCMLLQTPGQNAVVLGCSEDWEAMMPLFALNIKSLHPDLTGVNGRPEVAQAFAKHYSEVAAITHEMKIFRLDEVAEYPSPSGQSRAAVKSELDVCAEYFQRFLSEALGEVTPRDAARRNMASRLHENRLYVWDSEGPVCVLCCVRPTYNGICLACVYTPKAQRRKGYGAALSAEVSQKMLDEGFQFVCLYADAHNATSIGVYERIGYKEIGEFWVINFSEEKAQ